MTRKILMPMDGGQHSHRALNWYVRNFNARDDELVFAFVAEPPRSAIGDVTSADKVSSSMAENIAKAKALANDASQNELSHNAGQAIVDLANEENADVILIGNRGIRGIKKAFLGSVSDYVLHHSHRTTIIVPPPPKDTHH
uniref:Usp domain-containing protein n=1 Tax=Macrostomum lignano TaxID=282301 RepID=A0A1I8J8C4_9PLAT